MTDIDGAPAVFNVKLNDHRGDFVVFKNNASECRHRWEFHIWEVGRAYCPACGSFAEASNDPRNEP